MGTKELVIRFLRNIILLIPNSYYMGPFLYFIRLVQLK